MVCLRSSASSFDASFSLSSITLVAAVELVISDESINDVGEDAGRADDSSDLRGSSSVFDTIGRGSSAMVELVIAPASASGSSASSGMIAASSSCPFASAAGVGFVTVLASEITDRRGKSSSDGLEIVALSWGISSTSTSGIVNSVVLMLSDPASSPAFALSSAATRLFSFSLYISRNFIRRCFSRVMPGDLGRVAGNDFTL